MTGEAGAGRSVPSRWRRSGVGNLERTWTSGVDAGDGHGRRGGGHEEVGETVAATSESGSGGGGWLQLCCPERMEDVCPHTG